MTADKTILITGAAGNLGGKLRRHLEDRYPLRLLDVNPRGDDAIAAADLSRWDDAWAGFFGGVDTVFHFAANPTAHGTWEEILGPNVDALVHVYTAAVRGGVKRLIYASSNHVMGGYSTNWQPGMLTSDLPPRPGAAYVSLGQDRNSTPYGTAKLFGERLGKTFSELHDLSVIAVRIGWVRPGANLAEEIPPERGDWFRLMWLSNRDFCQLMEKCLHASPGIRFTIVNGMSQNAGMPWDLSRTREQLGYAPKDGVGR